MKVCQQCGFKNTDSSKFCTNCGSNIENMVSVMPDNVQNNAENRVPASPQPSIYGCGGEVLVKPLPEHERLKKFAKQEKKAVKKISVLTGHIGRLFLLCATEEEYRKTATYFKAWVNQYVAVKFPQLSGFEDITIWDNFKISCINGLLSLMIIGEYEECLKYSNILLDQEEILYKKGINGRSAGLITMGIKIASNASLTTKQREFIGNIKFFKAICLCDIGKYSEARELLHQLPPNYTFILGIDNPYFNQNFKYDSALTASYFLDLTE